MSFFCIFLGTDLSFNIKILNFTLVLTCIQPFSMPHENDRGHYSPGASEASDAAVTVTQIDEKITDSGPLPYWLVNVPHDKWPSECPEFLRNISEKNIWVLSTPDELYRRQDWETVKRIKGEFSCLPWSLGHEESGL